MVKWLNGYGSPPSAFRGLTVESMDPVLKPRDVVTGLSVTLNVLLICNKPPYSLDASTILDHILAFKKYWVQILQNDKIKK